MRLLFLMLLFSFSLTALAQQKMPIERIEITGNTKTKYYIIYKIKLPEDFFSTKP
jgi:cell division septal protein FtsQ